MMVTDTPLVSIITPAYNRAAFLDETILSVLSQDYPNTEYIVLDDGSKDNTQDVLRKYDGRLRWETHANMGETRTVNKGFEMARGEIIVVVNSDDPLLPGAISAAVNALHDHPEALAAYPDWLEIGPRSEPLREYLLPDYDLQRMLFEFNVAMGPATFFRRRAIELIGLRSTDVRYTGDLDYWFRLALHGPFVHIRRILATHRTHPDAASSSAMGKQMASELVRIAKTIHADPLLPAHLRKYRRHTLRAAHRAAIACCGPDRKAKLHHMRHRYGLALLDLPKECLRRCVRAARRAAAVASKIWPFIADGTAMALLGNALYLAATLVDLRISGRRRMKRVIQTNHPRHRFALVSHVLPPSWSGQAVIIGRIFSGLDPQSYCLISVQNYDAQDKKIDFSRRLSGSYHHLKRDVKIPAAWRFRMMRRFDRWMRIALRGCQIAKIMIRERCDTVVVATGDVIDPPAAHLAVRLTGARLFLYLFDDFTYQWLDPEIRGHSLKVEQRMARNLSGAIAPNEFMQAAFHQRHGVLPAIIRNVCAGPPEHAPRPAASGTCNHPMRILYTGAVYHVNASTFRSVIAALELLDFPAELHLYTAQTPDHLATQDIHGPRVKIHQHAPHEEVEMAQRSADLLLVPFAFGSPMEEVIRTSLPGKLGDYLASGTPVLAVVPPDCFVAWYLRTHDCGVVVDQDRPEAIAAAVGLICSDAERRSRISANAQRQASVDFDAASARVALRQLLEIHA